MQNPFHHSIIIIHYVNKYTELNMIDSHSSCPIVGFMMRQTKTEKQSPVSRLLIVHINTLFTIHSLSASSPWLQCHYKNKLQCVTLCIQCLSFWKTKGSFWDFMETQCVQYEYIIKILWNNHMNKNIKTT